MARTDNYLIQAQQAKSCFLTYDAEALAKKLNAKLDADFLYTTFFGQSYRVSRKTGDIQRLENGAWRDGNSYEEVMTLLDLICDSREDRHVSGTVEGHGRTSACNFTRSCWKTITTLGRSVFRTIFPPSAGRVWHWAASLFPWGTQPMPLRFSTVWASPSSCGWGTTSSRRICAFCGMRTPTSTSAMETMYFAKALLLSRIAGQMEES